MTMEEEVEALVEGGGRWASNRHRRNATIVAQYPRDEVVFDASDPRIRPTGAKPQQALRSHQVGHDPRSGLTKFGDRPERRANAPVVGDFALGERHVEVAAHYHGT